MLEHPGTVKEPQKIRDSWNQSFMRTQNSHRIAVLEEAIDGDEFKNKYTVTDFGWYLNKSKETYQFNSMNAKKAVMRLCSDFNIPIDSVPELTASITQIYIDRCISDILSDILEKCGGGYNSDMTPSGIWIYIYGAIYAYPEFRIIIKEDYRLQNPKTSRFRVFLSSLPMIWGQKEKWWLHKKQPPLIQ